MNIPGSPHWATSIDNTTDTILGNLSIGYHAFRMLTVGNKVYVAQDSREVSVINAVSNTVMADIPTPGSLQGEAWSGNYVYVCNINGTSCLSKINRTTNAIDANLGLGDAGWPGPKDVTTSGAYGYVIFGGQVVGDTDWRVNVFDTTTNAVTTVIHVPTAPISISAAGSYVYVNRGSAITVINATTNTVATTIPVAINYLYKYGSLLFGIGSSGSLLVINPTTNAYYWLSLGAGSQSVSITGSSNYVFVANKGTNTLSVVKIMSTPVVLTDTIPLLPAYIPQGYTGGGGAYTGPIAAH